MSVVALIYLVAYVVCFAVLLREFGKGCQPQPVDLLVEGIMSLFWPLWAVLWLLNKAIGDEPYIPEYEDWED